MGSVLMDRRAVRTFVGVYFPCEVYLFVVVGRADVFVEAVQVSMGIVEGQVQS